MGLGLLCLRTRSPHPGTQYGVAFGGQKQFLLLMLGCKEVTVAQGQAWAGLRSCNRGGKKWCKCACLQGSKGGQPRLRAWRGCGEGRGAGHMV